MKLENKKNNRIEYFDQMRGIAELSVVISHLLPLSFGVENSLLFAFVELPIFCYISGYFSINRKKNITIVKGINIIWKTFLRLILPMLTIGLISQFFTGYDFKDALLYRSGGRYWFLYALFAITILGTLSHIIISRFKKDVFILDALIYLIPIIPFLIVKFLAIPSNSIIPINSIICYSPFYILGALAGKYTKIQSILSTSKVLLALSILIVILGTWLLQSYSNTVLVSVQGIAIIVILLHILLNCNQDSYVLKYLSRIGKSTLAIYLLHYFFLFDARWLSTYLVTGNPILLQLLLSLFFAVMISTLCMALEWLLNISPITRFIFWGKITKRG